MFATVKQIFSPKNKDLQKRIAFTFFVLFIFMLGTTVVVPVIDKENLLGNIKGFDLFNIIGGGALEKFSIFALGVSPYITASIIIQLLQMDIVPYLSDLKDQGQVGRDKINKITRVTGIILAFVQGYLFAIYQIKGLSAIQYMEIATIFTAGTAAVLWMGDQITQKGIGNGISLIIMAGIVASMPNMFSIAWTNLIKIGGTSGSAMGILSFIAYILVYIFVIVGIIYTQLAERRIPIQYENKSVSTYQSNNSYLPFKLNSAGVMPVIFASGLISLPSMMASLMGSKYVGFQTFVNKWLSTSSYTGFILYMIFIIIFAYFYTFKVAIKTDEMAKNLNRNGGFIPGIRPGKETEEYVSKVLKRVTFVGALTLCVIAGLPVIFGVITKLPSAVSLGGTGMLIVVGVALETYKQIESTILSRNYETRNRRRRKI